MSTSFQGILPPHRAAIKKARSPGNEVELMYLLFFTKLEMGSIKISPITKVTCFFHSFN